MKTLTCNGCAFDGACERQKDKRAALRGLGITTVKFICKDRRDAFSPGQPVIFTTYVVDDDGEYRSGAIEVSYQGHCIKQFGLKVFGFIKPGTEDAGGEGIPFEAQKAGFVKMPMRRVKADDTRLYADLSYCDQCGAYAGLGQCFKDPHYTPRGKCAAENMTRAGAEVPSS
jgi:hypothetical protein